MQNHYWKRQSSKSNSFRPIFKIQPFSQDAIIINRPDDQKLLILSHQLQIIQEIKTASKPQSLAVHNSEIFAGCHDGQIIRIDQKKKAIKIESNNGDTYINDIMVDDDSIINCYNNGNITIWDRTTLKERQTMKIHSTYTYKLRRQHETLFSCSHDKRVAVTDLNRCQPIRYLPHSGSVWGIYATSDKEVATVGLFGSGMIWDVRSARCTQHWKLQNDESSFITAMNETQFVMGDQRLVKTYDRRTGRVVTRGSVQRSVQAILVLKDNLVVMGGRGGDLVTFKYDELVQKDTRVGADIGLGHALLFPIVTHQQLMQAMRDAAQIQIDEDDIIEEGPEIYDEDFPDRHEMEEREYMIMNNMHQAEEEMDMEEDVEDQMDYLDNDYQDYPEDYL